MNDLKLVCLVKVFDAVSFADVDGVNPKITVLNQRQKHGSDLILKGLSDFSDKNQCSMKILNENSHDDHWLIGYASNGGVEISRVILSLQKYSGEYTQWGIWKAQGEAGLPGVIDGIPDYLAKIDGLMVNAG